MSDLTYHVPDQPARPFARGDEVETVDREGNSMGRQRITKADKRIVHTDCGRAWTQDGDWWNGERAYPFPTIRHAS
ncbi:hypothetical protein [Azospirillum sp. sgz302134]